MKKIILVLALSTSGLLFAQKPGDTYNTNVGKARTVHNAKGGTININKVDSLFIGQIIINQAVKTKIFFNGVTTFIDSNGIYNSKYDFVTTNNAITYDVEVGLKFDKPFIVPKIPAYSFMSLDETGNTMGSEILGDDHMGIAFRGQVVNSRGFYFLVTSKERLHATIYGCDGEIKK